MKLIVFLFRKRCVVWIEVFWKGVLSLLKTFLMWKNTYMAFEKLLYKFLWFIMLFVCPSSESPSAKCKHCHHEMINWLLHQARIVSKVLFYGSKKTQSNSYLLFFPQLIIPTFIYLCIVIISEPRILQDRYAVENETIKRYPLWGLQRGILKEVRVYIQLATEKETFFVTRRRLRKGKILRHAENLSKDEIG